MAVIMTLWISNGAVLQSSSPWHLKEFSKLNNSVHELFNSFPNNCSIRVCPTDRCNCISI